MKVAVLAAILFTAGGLAAQQMYRCTGADGSVSFQDKPCAAGARQSVTGSTPSPTTAGPVRLRPRHTLTAAQKADYQSLFIAYAEVFRVLGRATKCNDPRAEQRFQEILKAMTERHGPHDEIAMGALVGLGAGMDNKLIGHEPDQTRPPVPVPCDVIAGHLANLRLPDVPRSLVLGEVEPIDHELKRGRLPMGEYRMVKRTPAQSGAEHFAVLYDDKTVFTSPFFIERIDGVQAPVPVIVVGVRDSTLRCDERSPRLSWHAIGLRRGRDAEVTRLDADCKDVRVYHRGAGFKRPSACIDLGAQPNRRFFAVDDVGRIAATSEPAPGTCR